MNDLVSVVLVIVRLAVEPARWFGEHVVIPMSWSVSVGLGFGIIWFLNDRHKEK